MAMMSMDSLCGGALLQRFNLEMARIGQNIMNPNTDPKAARKLVVTLTFKPDESRQMVSTAMQVKTSLAPMVPVSTVMLAGQDLRTGMISLSEHGGGQQGIATPGEALPVEVETIQPDDLPRSSAAGSRPIDLRSRAI